jgi:hypothetical protein
MVVQRRSQGGAWGETRGETQKGKCHMKPTILAIGLMLALAAPVLAQNANSQKPLQNNQAQAHPQNLQQEVQNNLKSAGFTDIKIMPESFLVRAKDKSGNPVMMVINPDSITAVTEESSKPSAPSTTGSAPPSRNSGVAPAEKSNPHNSRF